MIRVAARRKDVFPALRSPSESRRRNPRHSAAALRRGTDSQGRFIGERDIERGLKHFWGTQHRRDVAPLVRGE